MSASPIVPRVATNLVAGSTAVRAHSLDELQRHSSSLVEDGVVPRNLADAVDDDP